MPTALLIRTHEGHLVAADAYSKGRLDKMPAGSYVRATLNRMRNPQFHRKFFALLNLIFENQSHYHSLDDMLDAIKVYVGHCEIHELRDGAKVVRPKSIAFDNMGEDEFEDFFEAVIGVVRTKIIPGISREDLVRELSEFTQ